MIRITQKNTTSGKQRAASNVRLPLFSSVMFLRPPKETHDNALFPENFFSVLKVLHIYGFVLGEVRKFF